MAGKKIDPPASTFLSESCVTSLLYYVCSIRTRVSVALHFLFLCVCVYDGLNILIDMEDEVNNKKMSGLLLSLKPNTQGSI